MNRILLIGICWLLGHLALASEGGLMEDFDSLGGNDALLEKAQALQPESRIQIVQNRIVDRMSRHEFNGEFGNVLDGDSYLKSYSGGINYHYHITPRWSLGLKYAYGFNQLTDEANRSIDLARDTKNKEGGVPDMDWVKQKYMATVNYYPIYGKLNVFDMGVVHFDVYGLIGAGQVELRRGEAKTYAGGAGIGLWFSQHLTARMELRYETYEALRIDGRPRQMEVTVGSLQLGYML